jgi:hypothetical protein
VQEGRDGERREEKGRAGADGLGQEKKERGDQLGSGEYAEAGRMEAARGSEEEEARLHTEDQRDRPAKDENAVWSEHGTMVI